MSSSKRKNIEGSLLPGLGNGGSYSPTKVILPHPVNYLHL